MKHILKPISAFLFLCLLLSSCNAPFSGDETTAEVTTEAVETTEETTEAVTEAATTDIAELECIHPFLTKRPITADDIAIGMLLEDVVAMLGDALYLDNKYVGGLYGEKYDYVNENGEVVSKLKYIMFFLDKEENSVVVEFSRVPEIDAEGAYSLKERVTEIYTYPKREQRCSIAEIESLQEGMTVREVFDRIGIPIGKDATILPQHNAGAKAWAWWTTEGDTYYVYFKDGGLHLEDSFVAWHRVLDKYDFGPYAHYPDKDQLPSDLWDDWWGNS